MTVMKFCRLRDGRSISYLEQGSGPVLVLLHGWGMSSAVFAPIMGALSGCFRVLAPDLRGHGRSAPGPGYRLEDLAGDIEEWLETVQITDCCLFGWSLGGMVALDLAERLGDRLTRLILVSTTPCFVERESWKAGQPEAQVKILARQFRRDPRQAMQDFFLRQFDGEDIDEEKLLIFRRTLLDSSPLPTKEAGLGCLDTLCRTDLRHRGGVDVPTLVVHGTGDSIIPVAAGKYLSAYLPNAQWVALDRTGHAPFISRSEQCGALIRTFLR